MNRLIAQYFSALSRPPRRRPKVSARLRPAAEGLGDRVLPGPVVVVTVLPPPAEVVAAPAAAPVRPAATGPVAVQVTSPVVTGAPSDPSDIDPDKGEVKDQISIEVGSDPGV